MDLTVTIGLVIVVLGVLIYWINWRLTKNFGYWETQGITTINPGYFFLSTLELFRKCPVDLEKERYQKYGRLYGSYDFGVRTLNIADPDVIKQVLVKDFHVFTNRRDVKLHVPELDSAMSIARDEQWKRIRTVVSPSFTSGKMRKMNPLFMEATDGLVQNFEAAADRMEQVDLNRYFSSFTADVLGLTVFGIRVDALKNPDHPFVVNNIKIFHKNSIVIAIMIFVIPGFMKLFGRWAMGRLGLNYFFDATETLLKKRKEQPEAIRQVDLMQLMMDAREGKLENDEKEKDYIQSGHYFQDGANKPLPAWNITKTLSDTEIKAQALNFLLVGHGSTATSLAFVAYELALNPDVQEKLYQEAKDMYEQHGEFNYDVVKKMNYLEAVISETLRVHTQLLRLERTASEDYVLGSTGIVVPKGCVVAISTYALHHDPEWFPDPEKFDPDRFLPENRSSIQPYTYLPFGEGPRNCVAMRFALLQLKLCVATLVRKIKFVATDDTRKEMEYFIYSGVLIPKEVKARPERRN